MVGKHARTYMTKTQCIGQLAHRCGGIRYNNPTTRTNAPTGRVDRNRTKSGGKAPWPGFVLVGELAQVPHYPETRTSPGGYLHRV